MKGLALLRAAIYAKPGPMAETVARVCRRMNGEEEEAGKDGERSGNVRGVAARYF